VIASLTVERGAEDSGRLCVVAGSSEPIAPFSNAYALPLAYLMASPLRQAFDVFDVVIVFSSDPF